MDKQPIFLISGIVWATGNNGEIVTYAPEMVYPNEYIKHGASLLELREWQIARMGLDRFPYIEFEDPLFSALQQRDHFNDYLSDEEKVAMILSEYQARGCLEFSYEYMTVMWVKEITEAEYAIYKKCIRSPYPIPGCGRVGEYLGVRQPEGNAEKAVS